jgi:hypothetical protein
MKKNTSGELLTLQRQAFNFFTVLDLVKGTYTGLIQHHVMTARVHTA